MPIVYELDAAWFAAHGQALADQYGEDVLFVDKFMDSVSHERDCLPCLILKSQAVRHELEIAYGPSGVVYRPAADSTGRRDAVKMSTDA